MMKRKNQILAVLLSASMIVGTLVQAVPVQAETQLSTYGNIANQAVITATGNKEDSTAGSSNLVDGGKSTYSLYKFYAGPMSSEQVITMTYAEARKMDAFRITFENVGESDEYKYQFTYSIRAKNSADEAYDTIANCVTANRTDKSAQEYKFAEKTYSEIKIVMHSCTISTTNGGTSNGWPAVAEFEVYGSETTAADASRDATIIGVSAGNYEPNNDREGDPSYVLDGIASTHWHTVFAGSDRTNHELIFTFDDVKEINGMRFLQRQNFGDKVNGKVTAFDLYTRQSEEAEWTRIIEGGTLSTATAWQKVDFATVRAKQVKFKVVDSASAPNDNRIFSAAAEIRFTQVDYRRIDEAIEAASGKFETDYTGSSWTALQDALTVANAAKDSATQAQIDEATATLNEAISNLVARANFADLNSAIQAAKAKKDESAFDTYTNDSVNYLNTKLEQATAMAADTNATQEAVNKMAQELNSAIDGLQIDDAKVAEKKLAAAKAALNAKIAETQNFITANSKYDCRALEALVTEAQELVDLPSADVASVNGKVTALTSAMENFQYHYVITVDGKIVATGAYNTRVTINAPAAEKDMKFAGWIVDGKIISTKENYTFCIANSMEITAKFVEIDKAVEISPSANMANTLLIKRGDGKANARFVAQLIVPEGYTLVETGLLWCTKDTPATLYGENGAVPTGVKKLVSPTVNMNYQFSSTINGMPVGKFVRGVIYAKVKNNATGVVTWVYSVEEKIAY